jgi:hypothetical protein
MLPMVHSKEERFIDLDQEENKRKLHLKAYLSVRDKSKSMFHLERLRIMSCSLHLMRTLYSKLFMLLLEKRKQLS